MLNWKKVSVARTKFIGMNDILNMGTKYCILNICINVTRNLACGICRFNKLEVVYLPKLSRFCHYLVEQPPGMR